MSRQILADTQIHPAIRGAMTEFTHLIVEDVKSAIAADDVVVVGMAINPYPRRARKALILAKQSFRYLEYGSYLRGWRVRTVLKMWSGWPTFPMIFVNGVLIGGASELQSLIDSGDLTSMLKRTT